MQHIITSIEQVTPAWLTDVLRTNGHLINGQVQTITVTAIHDEQIHSLSYFLTIKYASNVDIDLPTRLFLKLPRPGSDVVIAEREVGMYQFLAAHQQALPIVRCYSTQYVPKARAYHVLLEDLSTTHTQPTWHLDIVEHYITATVDCLAQLHAYWWDHPTLPELRASMLLPDDDGAELAVLRQELPAFLNVLGDQLTLADCELYEHTLATISHLWSTSTEDRGQTLVHGDAHFWNFLYPRDPTIHRTCLLDWQCVHVGMGIEDITYAIILRYPHRTAMTEYPLVRRYHAQLLAHGVTNYSWECCWASYRRAATLHLLTPVRYWRGGLPESFWGMFVSRTLEAVRDLAPQ